MQGIILAAGMGRRLGEHTKNDTKCMLPVNGERLIDRLLNQLSKLNLKRVTIVVGHKGENVINHVGHRYDGTLKIEWVYNPIYDKTNNIYSLSLVKDRMLEDDTLLIESDLIVDERMFEMILEDSFPNLALVAKYETWMDGTMVTIDEDNNIMNFVPKQAFRPEDIDRYYKTCNIYKFSRGFSQRTYVPFLEAYVKAQGNNEYYEQVLRIITIINNSELKAKPIGNIPWYEIDDIQDKDIAEAIFSNDKNRLDKYMKRYGGYWRFEHLLDFCYLVNPYFPPQKMHDEIKINFDRLLVDYPSGMEINSLLASKCFNIRQEYIVVGNGASELIKSIMEHLEGKIGMVYPTFEEYPHRRGEEEIVKFYPSDSNFTYTAKDLMSFFGNKEIQALLLVNPDNPSGNMISATECLDLAKWCQSRNIRFILDESFVDFSDDGENSSMLKNEILQENPNMVVIKSISKSYGVPGLRLGIMASSNKSLIEWMKKDVAIWNINSFAEFYMQIFNKYEKDYRAACRIFRTERKRFYEELQAIHFLRVIPSQANYFLAEVTNKYSSRELAEILLNRFNILIKDCETKNGLEGKNMIRIAIRDNKDNNILLEALKAL